MRRALPVLLAALLLASCTGLPTAGGASPSRAAATPSASASATAAATQRPATARPSPSPSAAPVSASPSPSAATAVPTASPSPTPAPTSAPNPIATASAAPTPPPPAAALSMKLPPALYGVAGRRMDVWFDNLVLCDGEYALQVSGPGALEGSHWSWMPEEAGVYRLDVRAGNRSGSVEVVVAPADAGTGRVVRCLFIGDSTTDRGSYTGLLLGLMENDGMKLALLGSRGKAPNLHEGRVGWKSSSYTGCAVYGGIANSFYNPKSKKFDFAYYMKRMGYKSVDYVFFHLGINDMFFCRTDAAAKAEADRVLKRFDTMIASVRRFGAGIRVGVMVTIPPTDDADVFRGIYADRQTLARYRRNNYILARALTGRYAASGPENVFLVPVRACINPQLIDGVHPRRGGYSQMAESVWSWLKCMER